MKPISYIPLLIATATLVHPMSLCAQDKASDQAGSSAATTEKAAPSASISPEELAKTKNVPGSIKDKQGDYTLVAVVEGEDANRKLTESLRVIGSQRQRLAALTRQFEQTSADLPQQRELLATQINQMTKTLKKNLIFMSQNFAYSLNYNYLMVPHKSSLISVTQKEGKTETKVVYQFNNADSYRDCQKKRDSYLQLKQKQAQANKKKAEADKESPKLKPTPEMEKIRKELIKLYKYDPEKPHQVNFLKTAIYARAIR